jgi:transketolase
VLLGDGECHEGSVWESAMFAGHHGLANLTVIVDCNQFSASERIEDYLSVEPLVDKWRAFGWDAEAVDGHDVGALLDAYGRARESERRAPLAILASFLSIPIASGITVKPTGANCRINISTLESRSRTRSASRRGWR